MKLTELTENPPSLREKFFRPLVLSLLLSQIICLGLGYFIAVVLLTKNQWAEAGIKAEKSADLFALLAKYGDVRYAKFVVAGYGGPNGLAKFQVFDSSSGAEIQALDPQNEWKAPIEVLASAQNAIANFQSENRTLNTAKLLSQKSQGNVTNNYFLVKSSDGSFYIVATEIKSDSIPIGTVTLAALFLIFSSIGISVLFAKGKAREIADSLATYGDKVGKIAVESSPKINVPYLELKPIQASLEEMVENLRKQSKLVAIAQMTQMLAHDVRKPFSMLKTGLNLLQSNANNPQKFRSNLSFLVTEIDRATKSVDGMLSDVMEIGSTSTALIQEPVLPETLIEETLGEIFRIYPKSKIKINYELHHSSIVNIHLKKVSRVFSNIVGNAVQAMNYTGLIWFKTDKHRVDDREFVKFCIGNAGSYISEEGLSRLFEAFHTAGKKGGTGLGLAIAQKVVHAHGGKIWCESAKTTEFPDGKVEFFFTLPVAAGVEINQNVKLPKHSDEITEVIALMGQGTQSQSHQEFNKSENLLIQEVLDRSGKMSQPIEMLLVDDEAIYRNALAGWIEENSTIKSRIKIHHAVNSHEAIDLCRKIPIDLVVTDIDMGNLSASGFDLVQALRTDLGFKGLIFVHSNRIVPDDHKRTVELGADGFLPKPMAKGQLLKLLLQAIKPGSGGNDAQSSPEGAGTGLMNAGTLAVIDDEDLFRDQWPTALNGIPTACYSSGEDFVRDWDQIQGHLKGVLTDKFLGNGIDGISLAKLIKKRAPDLPLFLSTSDLSVKNDDQLFALIVDKDAFEEAPKILKFFEGESLGPKDLPTRMRQALVRFQGQVNALREIHEGKIDQNRISEVISDHLDSWKELLIEVPLLYVGQLKSAQSSMGELKLERLIHDFKASMTRIKILLRQLDDGESDVDLVCKHIEARFNAISGSTKSI